MGTTWKYWYQEVDDIASWEKWASHSCVSHHFRSKCSCPYFYGQVQSITLLYYAIRIHHLFLQAYLIPITEKITCCWRKRNYGKMCRSAYLEKKYSSYFPCRHIKFCRDSPPLVHHKIPSFIPTMTRYNSVFTSSMQWCKLHNDRLWVSKVPNERVVAWYLSTQFYLCFLTRCSADRDNARADSTLFWYPWVMIIHDGVFKPLWYYVFTLWWFRASATCISRCYCCYFSFL